MKAKDLIEYIESFASLEFQEDWDNSGIQIGDLNQEVSSIVLAMDVTDQVVDYAIDQGANLIISHHPFFFKGEKSIDYNTYKGNLIRKIIKEDIFVYSSHTSLDIASGGVNDSLAKILKIDSPRNFEEDGEKIIGLYGKTSISTTDELIDKIDWSICPKSFMRIYGKYQEKIEKIALVGGSGGSYINTAKRHNCNILLTGDVDHHQAQEAYEKSMMVIDMGHFYSELPALIDLSDRIQADLDLNTHVFKNPVWVHRIDKKN